MKTKIAVLTILCGSALWMVAQTGGAGGPPDPGAGNNHGYAAPGGSGAFVAPGTGNHGFAAPGQTNGFVTPGHGFVTPGLSNRFVVPGNGFVNPGASNGVVPPDAGH